MGLDDLTMSPEGVPRRGGQPWRCPESMSLQESPVDPCWGPSPPLACHPNQQIRTWPTWPKWPVEGGTGHSMLKLHWKLGGRGGMPRTAGPPTSKIPKDVYHPTPRPPQQPSENLQPLYHVPRTQAPKFTVLGDMALPPAAPMGQGPHLSPGIGQSRPSETRHMSPRTSGRVGPVSAHPDTRAPALPAGHATQATSGATGSTAAASQRNG